MLHLLCGPEVRLRYQGLVGHRFDLTVHEKYVDLPAMARFAQQFRHGIAWRERDLVPGTVKIGVAYVFPVLRVLARIRGLRYTDPSCRRFRKNRRNVL